MKTLLLLLALGMLLPSRSSAQILEKFVDGDGLKMLGGVEWTDTLNRPWHKRKIVELTLNNLDLNAEDVIELAKYRLINYLQLGFGPEGVNLKTEDTSPLGALKKLKTLELHVSNLELKHLGFFSELKELRTLKIDRHHDNRWEPDESFAALIAGIRNLEALELGFNGLNDATMKTLTKMEN